MGARTAYAPGTFCWADLSTKDAEAAQRFYGELLGWEFHGPIAMLDGAAVAAIYPLPDDSPHPSHWNSYVAVEHADDAAAIALELGAELIESPFDVEPAGRLSLIRDPGGAVLAVWEAADHIGAGLVNAPGALCWNHLSTGDLEGAKRFYAALFDWGWDGDVCKVGEQLNGSAGALPPGAPPSWSAVFGVADLAAAQRQVPELGGTILTEPAEFGPGRFIAVADPTGAAVSFYEGEYDD